MSLSIKDYIVLYQLQDKFFKKMAGRMKAFYLTGGTALSRFYLNHRFSDDLDFFVNKITEFLVEAKFIHSEIKEHFTIDQTKVFEAEGFYRIWIEGKVPLKIEFVNDIAYHEGSVNVLNGIKIDNPLNILSNKLTAVLSRDEPKDVFDIVSLANAYSFNWREVYYQALQKQLTNETDICMRLSTFPVRFLEEVKWKKETIDTTTFQDNLNTLVDDFLFAKDNSLGYDKTPIEEAKPYDFWAEGK